MSTNCKILNRIERWKRDLIDLSNRNNLLNFKAKPTNSVKIFEGCDSLYDTLVTEEKTVNCEKIKTSFSVLVEKILKIDIPNEEKEAKVQEERMRFRKILSKLRLAARTRMNEQGINILFLTLGVLKWSDTQNADASTFIAPVLLVPLELNRLSSNEPFKMKFSHEDVVVNPFLAHKLREEHGIVLPDVDDKDNVDIDEIFKLIRNQISNLKKWEVIEDIYISLFSFNKLVMYKDMETYKDLIANHPLICRIAGEDAYEDSPQFDITSVPSEEALDREVSSETCYQILDADSSQLQAILAAKKGLSFVIQGPPGTGKSQTIANIIAECLALDKKILFVSEKMAALEVVKSRLEQVGLGDMCLEMHSYKANKKVILDAMADIITKNIHFKRTETETFKKIDFLRNELNVYPLQLHKERKPFKKSVFQVHGILAQLDDVTDVLFDFKIEDDTDFEAIKRVLGELEVYRKYFSNEMSQPWQTFIPANYSLELSARVKAFLDKLSLNFNDIFSATGRLHENYGVKLTNYNEFDHFKDILQLAWLSPKPPIEWFNSNNLPDIIKHANDYQDRFIKFQEDKGLVIRNFDEEIFSLPLQQIVADLFQNQDVSKITNCGDLKVLLEGRDTIYNSIDRLNGFFNTLEELSDTRLQLGLKNVTSIEELNDWLLFSRVIASRPRPTKAWFNKNMWNFVKGQINEVREKHQLLESQESEILVKYNPEILDIDLHNAKNAIDSKVKEVNQKLGLDEGQLLSKRIELSHLFEHLRRLFESFKQEKSTIEYYFCKSLNNIQAIKNLRTLIELVEKNPRPQPSWLNVTQNQMILNSIPEIKNTYEKYKADNSWLNETFDEDVLQEEKIAEIYKRLENEYQSTFRIFNGSLKKDKTWLKTKLKNIEKLDFQSFEQYIKTIKRVIENKKVIKDKEIEHTSTFGFHFRGIETDWNSVSMALLTVREIIDLYSAEIPSNLAELLVKPSDKVIQIVSSYNNLVAICSELEKTLGQITANCPALLENWLARPFESWNLDDVIQVAKHGFETLNLCYTEIDLVLDKRKNIQVPDVNVLMSEVDSASTVVDLKNVISQNANSYKDLIGSWYDGSNTQWDELGKAIETFENLLQAGSIPNEVKEILISDNKTIHNSSKILERSLSELNSHVISLESILPGISLSQHLHSNINMIKEVIDYVSTTLNKWFEGYDVLFKLQKADEIDLQTLRNYIEIAINVNSNKVLIENNLENLQNMFGNFFKGFSTNWTVIFDALAWIENWQKIASSLCLSDKLLSKVSQEAGDEEKDLFNEFYKETKLLLEESNNLKVKLNELFLCEKDDLYSRELTATISWVNAHLETIEEMETWVRYQRLINRSTDLGLTPFINAVSKGRNLNGNLNQLFTKRLFKIWLDNIYKVEDSLYEFNASNFSETIKKFNVLDTKTFDMNVNRIREKYEQNRNHAINSLAYRREQGVLNHEIGKKKRHIPIRRLICQTSGLFQQLKPCLLMSPLSVSQFIDPKYIQFDMVIFDEASQIFSEDAIGAILRAKQVIIVGDTKQLPPTNFFRSLEFDEEFDDDEEDVNFESILDECQLVLDNLKLRWHYRSRHETLIAFSNRAFYQNTLITFPSAVNGPEVGVKFMHVQDGVYDRGGSKKNVLEAQKISQMVFEHFQENPEKSLGVIAFSEAQASAIHDQLELLREQHPYMERFFKEGIKDEFFIKSLESVQGDERDVIFISVGYGKAHDGKINKNFGPLTKSGGERRLNVAITRAKHSLSIVSSFMPGEINLDNSQSVGLRRLCEYMQFAMDGKLPEEVRANRDKDFDSPFEEDVYNVLESLGYQVETQVGCSGYKIDLAVVDPLSPDKYLLGIECDGRTYHSSKVARDRDRLRQQVLENLGWKIHRIWSQEWFKKRRSEIQHLINKIESLRQIGETESC